MNLLIELCNMTCYADLKEINTKQTKTAINLSIFIGNARLASFCLSCCCYSVKFNIKAAGLDSDPMPQQILLNFS